MPTITVSQSTLDALKALAEPFVDTPESVIARLVSTYGKPPRRASAGAQRDPAPPRTRRARRGEVTPRSTYRDVLRRVLRAADGELETRVAVERVGAILKKDLTPMDLAPLPTGEERWINAVRFARKDLIDAGELDPRAPHGVWRLRR